MSVDDDNTNNEEGSLIAKVNSIPANTYTDIELKNMRDNISKMDSSNHIEILKIVMNNNTEDINENNYGVHINLTEFPNKTLDQIKNYIEYVKSKEKEFIIIENIKNKYKQDYFLDENQG